MWSAHQVLEFAAVQRRKRNLGNFATVKEVVKAGIVVGLVVLAVVAYLWPQGYFGPLSARVRGLFVKHTRTGNPLVDSVAEHQPTNAQAYQQYLHHVYYLAPAGFALSFLRWTDANFFIITYGIVAYYFSSKMCVCLVCLVLRLTTCLPTGDYLLRCTPNSIHRPYCTCVIMIRLFDLDPLRMTQ